MKRSERWRKMRYDLKKPVREIIASFDKPTKMRIFSWTAPNNEIDTVTNTNGLNALLQIFLKGRDDVYGTTNRFCKGLGWWVQLQAFSIRYGKTRKATSGLYIQAICLCCSYRSITAFSLRHFSKSTNYNSSHKFGNMKPWAPKNSSKNYAGFETLKSALANSRNTITARLMNEIGPQPVINLAKVWSRTKPSCGTLYCSWEPPI